MVFPDLPAEVEPHSVQPGRQGSASRRCLLSRLGRYIVTATAFCGLTAPSVVAPTIVDPGLLEPQVPLDLALYLQSETSLAVWTAALAHLHSWREILGETSARQGVDSLVLSLLSQQYASLGWADTGSHLDKLLRQRVLGAMVQAGRREAVDKARALFRDLMAGNGTVAANLQGLVYGVGVREGGREEWRWCWERYLDTNVPSERSSLLKALGETRDVFTIQDFLEMTLDQSKVRGQDVQSVLAAVAANPAGNTVTMFGRAEGVSWSDLLNVPNFTQP